MTLTYRNFVAFAATFVLVAAAPLLLWRLSNVVILGFGALLMSALMTLVAEPFQRWTPLPRWLSLAFAGLIIFAFVFAAA
ncbi:MAG TPA: hypothetical protein VNF99_17115 [Stellaceae bacterium]|nr:hypothetical protein [Stellaceae bacterium]